jgi:hypothetical protein
MPILLRGRRDSSEPGFGGSQKLGLPASYKAPIVTFQKLTGTDAEAIGRRD